MYVIDPLTIFIIGLLFGEGRHVFGCEKMLVCSTRQERIEYTISLTSWAGK